MAELDASYRDMSVSTGTMLTTDLFPAFIEVLQTVHPTQALLFEQAFAATAGLAERDELLTSVFDALNNIAPEGTSFGAHPGDGSDYGFWTEDAP